MNRTNFVQTGGFPVKAERLQELQTAYEIFNQLGNLGGNLTILSGCEVVGTSVSDGFVFINNEVLEFKAGTLADDVIIIEIPSGKEFKNGEVKPVHYERYVTFGTSVTSFPWSSFKRVNPIITLMARLDIVEKKAAVFQAGGGMVLWNKPATDIPEGWAEVIDWRGRIPVGYDISQTEFNVVGKIGGAKINTLTINNLPPINLHLEGSNADNGDPGTKVITANTQSNSGLDIDVKTGSANSFSIMNPYRVVMFIEYIG